MQVFVSHSHTDKGLFARVAAKLTQAGLSVFRVQDIEAGAPLSARLRTAAHAADACIFIATEHSCGSDWCKAELGAFWALGKRVVVFLPYGIDSVALPPQFAGEVVTGDLQHAVASVTSVRRIHAHGVLRDVGVPDWAPDLPKRLMHPALMEDVVFSIDEDRKHLVFVAKVSSSEFEVDAVVRGTGHYEAGFAYLQWVRLL